MARASIRDAAEGFRRTFGRDPQGIWSAPGRVSVMGDHTDLQDGLAFGFGIDLRTTVAIATRTDGRITVATDLVPERAEAELATLAPGVGMDDWKAYPLGTVWGVLEYGRENPPARLADGPDEALFLGTGLDIFLTTEVPIGGGLSSSASICAALGLALSELWELEIPRMDLARIGRRVEQEAAGAATGIADQVIALFSAEGKDVFFDARGNDVSLIDVPDMAGARLTSVVVNTGEPHRNWSAPLAERRRECERAAEVLGAQTLREVRLADLEARAGELGEATFRRARHVVTEIQRVLDLTRTLRERGPGAIGPILDASQASLAEDFAVSTERIDFTVELARHFGAQGARLTGAGLGGSVFALLPGEAVPEFAQACAAAYAEHGWDAPDVRTVQSAEGARRDV